jgi:Domain of unknown function (DUF4780)
VEKQNAANCKGSTWLRFPKLPTLKTFGWALFYCADRVTADWLKALTLWKERGCEVLEEENLPREFVLTGYFLSSTDKPSKQVLEMIEA